MSLTRVRHASFCGARDGIRDAQRRPDPREVFVSRRQHLDEQLWWVYRASYMRAHRMAKEVQP